MTDTAAPSFNVHAEAASCMLVVVPLDEACQIVEGAPVYATSGYTKIGDTVEREDGKDYSLKGASGGLAGPQFRGPTVEKFLTVKGTFAVNDWAFKSLTTGNPLDTDLAGNTIGYQTLMSAHRSLCDLSGRPRVGLLVVTFAATDDGGCNLPAGDELRRLTIDATDGTTDVDVDGFTADALDFDTSAADLQTAIRAADPSLSTVTVTGGPGDAGGTTPYLIAFPDGLPHSLTATSGDLIGGAATATVDRLAGPSGATSCKGDFYPNVTDFIWDRTDAMDERRTFDFTARAYPSASAGHGILNLHTPGINPKAAHAELFLKCSDLPTPDLGATVPHPAVAA